MFHTLRMDLIRAGKSKVMTLRNFVQLNSCTGFTRTCTDSFHCRCVGQNTKLKRASESCYFLWIWEITNSINYFLVVVMQQGIFTALVLISCSRHLFWRTLFSHFMIERSLKLSFFLPIEILLSISCFRMVIFYTLGAFPFVKLSQLWNSALNLF